MLITKNNLVNFCNFSKNTINSKTRTIIIVYIKYTPSFPFVYNYLITMFNIKNITCEIFFISSQSEINYFCKKIYKKQNYFLLFFLNFGNNTDLKYFLTFNCYFIKKVFVIDFHTWLFSENFSLALVRIFCNNLLIKKKYCLMHSEEKKYFVNKLFFFGSFTIISSIFKLNFNFYDEIWINIICALVLRSFHLINQSVYKNIMFYASKKISFLKKKKKNCFFGKKTSEINLYVLKKHIHIPIFFIKFASLSNSLIYTPLFFIKFHLWKYNGILKLFRFFLKPSYYDRKKILTYLKEKLKKSGIRFPALNSFTKFHCFSSNFSLNQSFKISTNDFVHKIKTIKNNFYENYIKFFDEKVIKFNIRYTKINQKYITKIVGILFREKIYLNGFFFRYFFFKNVTDENLNLDTVTYISFYLMIVINSKFLIKKPLFAVWHTRKLNCVIGCFSDTQACKLVREKSFIRQTIHASLDRFVQLTKCAYLPVLHNTCN